MKADYKLEPRFSRDGTWIKNEASGGEKICQFVSWQQVVTELLLEYF
jgi:hypothetical protein